MKSPRRIAYDVLLEVERGAYANLALKQAAAQLDSRNAKFVYALVYTALDHQMYADFLIDYYRSGPVKPPIRCILRLGIAQLLYMDVPDAAACNESVALAKALGKGAAGGAINGILRSIARQRDALPQPEGSEAYVLAVQESWPLWLVEKLARQIGLSKTRSILAARPERQTSFSPNKLAQCDVEANLAARSMPFTRGKFVEDCLYADLGDVSKEPLFTEGAILLQGEASMLAADVAGAKQGMRVLDACAAPGGKTLRMAMQMGDGHVTTWDLHPHRAELIRRNAQRCHAPFVQAEVQDATALRPELENSFDLVLVDAPCSGLGVAGQPDIRYAKDESMIASLITLQRNILSTCARYVKPGGALVYATCTILREENEENFAWFLQEHPAYSPADIRGYLPDWFDDGRAQGGCVQLYPDDGIDGFFIAKAVRA